MKRFLWLTLLLPVLAFGQAYTGNGNAYIPGISSGNGNYGTLGYCFIGNGPTTLPTWQVCGGGSGTVGAGTAGQIATYSSTGTQVGGVYGSPSLFPQVGANYPSEVSLAGTLALNGTTDDCIAFNAYEAAQPANEVLVIPAYATMAIGSTTCQLNLSVAGHVLKFEQGAKIHLLNAAAAVPFMLKFSANNTGAINMEIDGNASGSQTNTISGWRTVGNITGVHLDGQTYIHDLTGYGAEVYDGTQITIQNFYGYNITQTCLEGLQNADTAQAQIYIQKFTCDKSTQPNTSTYGSMQILGTSAHPTYLFLNNTLLLNVIGATGSGGAEIRYSYGQISNFTSHDGVIGLSVGFGQKDLNISNVTAKGALQIGFEVAGTQNSGGVGGHVNISNLQVDGTNSAGTATTTRCVALDGVSNNVVLNLSNYRLSGCTDELLFVDGAESGLQQWTDVYFSNGDEDGSLLNGAVYGDHTCNLLNVAVSAAAGPQRVHFHNVWCHGGAAATRLLKTINSSYIYGDLGGDNINGALVEIDSTGAIVSNNYKLDIGVGANNIATGHVISTLTSGGTLGSNIQVSGNGLVSNATGFTVNYQDFGAGLISAYGTSTPNGVLNGAVGSTATLTSGAVYKNTNGSTAWALVSDANANAYSAGSPVVFVPCQSGTAATTTGTTTETNLAACAIPANAMGANGALRITVHWQFTNNSDTKTLAIRFNSTSGAISGGSVLSDPVTTGTGVTVITQIRNANATNAQNTWNSIYSSNAISNTSTPGTGTIATSSASYVNINCANTTSSADTCGIYGYTVEVLP